MSLDIPLIFDNVGASSSMIGGAADAQLVADQMSAAWAAFARTGCPQTAGLPYWPAYSTETRDTMCFDADPHVVADPEHDERLWWAGTPPRLPL